MTLGGNWLPSPHDEVAGECGLYQKQQDFNLEALKPPKQVKSLGMRLQIIPFCLFLAHHLASSRVHGVEWAPRLLEIKPGKRRALGSQGPWGRSVCKCSSVPPTPSGLV